MPPSTLSFAIRSARLGTPGAAMALCLLASCGIDQLGETFRLESSSPVTLVAGSFADVDISVSCDGTADVGLNWVTNGGDELPVPLVESGVVVPPVDSLVSCSAVGNAAFGESTVTVRLYAADNATPGRRTFIMQGSNNNDMETTDVLIDVVAPAAPGFSLGVPPQVVLIAGETGVTIPATAGRDGYAGSISLSWQPLLLNYGTIAGVFGGVRTGFSIADGSTEGSLRIEGPGVAAPDPVEGKVLRLLLVRARGGATERAAIVQILTSSGPPAAPADFRATPAVNSIQLAWTAAGNLLTYRLERETVSGTWELVSADLPGNSTSYTDTGRAPDTPYNYRLSATNVNGTSPFATLSTRTLPTPPPPGGTGWQQLGSVVTSNSEVEPQPSMLIDGLGRPVVAYRERGPGDVGRIIVKRYNAGGFWVQLGAGPLNTNPNDAFTPSMAIDAAGVLYVAWTEYTGVSQRVYVSRFPTSGGAWESVVPGNQPVDALGAAAGRPALAIPAGGSPILAWVQGGSIQVRTLTGGQWVLPPGGSGFTTTTAYDIRLRLDGATPVIAWAEGVGASNAIKVARGTLSGGGFTFTQVGGNASLPLPAGVPSIVQFGVVVDLGTTYVVYGEGVTEFTVRARRLNGSTWQEFGVGVVPVSGPQELMSLALPPSQLVVAFSARAISIDGSLFAASYATAGGWTLLTDIVNDNRISAPLGLSLAMASDRSPVVANGIQVGERYELRVRQYIQP